MLREILVPTQNTHVLHLPDAFIGKRVEVLAFEVDAGLLDEAILSDSEWQRRKAEILAITAGHRVDLSDFKFDRNEANNYNE